MRVLITAIAAGLLVAGCMYGKNIVSDTPVVMTKQEAIIKPGPQVQMKKINEALRLVLNNICSLSCGDFFHRNMTPEELYYALQKHVENYKKASDEAMRFCKINKIKPCRVFAVERDPTKLVNILTDFKKEPGRVQITRYDPMQQAFEKAGMSGIGDW